MLCSLTPPALELLEIKAAAESCKHIKADRHFQDSCGRYRKVVGEREGNEKAKAGEVETDSVPTANPPQPLAAQTDTECTI